MNYEDVAFSSESFMKNWAVYMKYYNDLKYALEELDRYYKDLVDLETWTGPSVNKFTLMKNAYEKNRELLLEKLDCIYNYVKIMVNNYEYIKVN